MLDLSSIKKMPVYSSLQFVKLRDTTTAILATPTANEHAGKNKNVQSSTPQTICSSKNKKKTGLHSTTENNPYRIYFGRG